MFTWKGKRILIVSAEAWGDMRLSKHHYATALIQQGAEVYFMGPHGAAGGASRVSRGSADAPNLVNAPPTLRGQRFLPRAFRAFLDARRMATVAKACGGGFDLLWNFDVYRFRSLRDRGHARFRIVHVMDLPVPSALPEPAHNADLLMAVSKGMLDTVATQAVHKLHVPHGLMPPAQELALAHHHDRNTPQIGYLGNLGIRSLDRNALLRIAVEHPTATLHLMGPWQGAFGDARGLDAGVLERLQHLPNVRFHGVIPSHRIAEALADMDVLLLAYDTVRYPLETVNSHKVLEYLYSGRTILAPHMPDLTDVAHLMVRCPPGESVADHMGRVLKELPALNTAERMAARRAYALSMTYDHHLQRIAEVIGELHGRI